MRTTGTVVALIVWIILAAGSIQAQINYPDLRSTPTLQLRGTAAFEGDRLRLTPSRSNSAGAAWHTERQYVKEGFITTFQFQISEPGGESDGVANGGDGLAFVIQNSDQGDAALGLSGGQIGYGGIFRSVAVEFDMWKNDFGTNGDPSHNHISVHTNGTGRNSSDHGYSLGQTSTVPDMGDGRVHTVSIEYLENWLNIYLDNCDNPLLRIPIDIPKLLALEDGHAWFGLTAGTASARQNHDILNWRSSSIGLLQSAPANLCQGDSIVLTIPTADGEVIWSDGRKGASIVAYDSGMYKAVVLEKLGCRDLYYDRLMNVTVAPRPEPKVTMSRNLKLCPGDTVTLDAGSGYSGYRWSNGARTQSIAVTEAGSYSVVVTNEFGCSEGSDPIAVTVYEPVTPIITPNRSLTLCAGDSVTLDAGEGYLFYYWSTGALTRTITVKRAGNYWVEGTDRNGCTMRSLPLRVSDGTVLHPIITASGPTELCDGAGVRLDAGADYTSYRWSNGDTTQTILVTAPGRYRVSVTSGGGCEGSSQWVDVVVHPRPLPTITSDREPIVCQGSSITLDAGAGYAGYRWSNGDSTRTITVDTPDRYTVTVTTEYGCTGSATLDVAERIGPRPVITPSGEIRLCSGDSLTLDAGDGYASYLWSNGERGSRITVHEGGIYSVTVSNAEGCFGTAPPAVVTAHERPTPQVTPEGPLNFCNGETLVLRTSPGYAAYRWSTGESTETIVVRTPGHYSVSVTDTNGCTGDSPVVKVEVGEVVLPQITLNGPATICPGDSVVLEAPAGYREYIWSTGERTRSITVRTAGRYHVEVHLSEECQGVSDMVEIGVHPGVSVPAISENGGALLSTPAVSYQWYFDDLPLAGATGERHIPAAYGFYRVAVTDANGCTAVSVPYPHFHAASAVMLPMMAAEPGAPITVPLTLQDSRNLDEDGFKRFRVAIRFDRSLLIPGAITTSCCGSVPNRSLAPAGTDGKEYLLTFEGERPAGLSSGTLAEIRFTLAIGEATSAPLVIDSFEWLDGRAAVATTDGMVRFEGICVQGGERLVSASGNLALKSIRPNPFSEAATIEYEIVEDGPTELYLVDQLGARAATLVAGTLRRGAYDTTLNAGALPAGTYMLVLQTPTESLSTMVQIVK